MVAKCTAFGTSTSGEDETFGFGGLGGSELFFETGEVPAVSAGECDGFIIVVKAV